MNNARRSEEDVAQDSRPESQHSAALSREAWIVLSPVREEDDRRAAGNAADGAPPLSRGREEDALGGSNGQPPGRCRRARRSAGGRQGRRSARLLRRGSHRAKERIGRQSVSAARRAADMRRKGGMYRRPHPLAPIMSPTGRAQAATQAAHSAAHGVPTPRLSRAGRNGSAPPPAPPLMLPPRRSRGSERAHALRCRC